MNAKCNYSAKFWPLVSQMKQTLSSEEFQTFMTDNFENGEQIYQELSGGIVYNTPTNTIFEPKPIDTTTDVILTDETDSVQSYYIGQVTEYNQMLRKFRTNIISKVIYDRTKRNPETNTMGVFIDAETIAENGHSILNVNLANYKIQLINILKEYLGEASVKYQKNLTASTFTKIQNEVLSKIALRSANTTSESLPQEIFDAFVTLKNFDKLLKEHTPFIGIRPEYSQTTLMGIDMYIYKGPNVKHFISWSSNKNVDVSEVTSDLVSTLLDYFPEVNDRGEAIENTSITVSGFNSALASVKAAIMYTDHYTLKGAKDEIFKGADMNVSKIIDAYLSYLADSDGVTEHITYLQGKLRGIQKFIYNSDLPQTIKNNFTALFAKTAAVSYRTYDVLNKEGIVSRSLKEQFTNVQSFRFNDIVQSNVYIYQNNPEKLKAVLDKYNITIDSNKSQIIFSYSGNDYTNTFAIEYTFTGTEDKNKFTFKAINNITDENTVRDIIYDLLSYIVPENFNEVGQQILGKKWRGTMDAFLPLIGLTILGGTKTVMLDTDNYGRIKMQQYTTDIQDISRVASVIYGSDTVNVIKNAEGNNLPLYQLMSLAYKYQQLSKDIINTDNSIYANNILLTNDIVKSPVVRSDVSFNGKIKKPADLGVSEVLRLGIVYDFYQNINRDVRHPDNGVIYLQNTTFSDKNTHFLIPFDTKKTIIYDNVNYNLQEILSKSITSGDTEKLIELYIKTRNEKMQLLQENLIYDYNTVFDEEFTTVQQIAEFLEKRNLSLEILQKAFADKKVNLYENIHYTKSKWGIRINETIQSWTNIYNDPTTARSRIIKEQHKFLKNLLEYNFTLKKSDDRVIKNMIESLSENWTEKDGITMKLARVFDIEGNEVDIPLHIALGDSAGLTIELNPILKTYFMTDILLSNEYNSLMIGEVYAHANKNKDGEGTQYNEFSEANRLIAQYKRAVILGGTHHPFLQGLKYGVAENINIAVISDTETEVFNMLGETKGDLEPMDGSGLSSPFQSLFENNSLMDAKVGEDKKTLMHSMDATYGNPLLLKWAVFNIHNERRRLSQQSDISLENIYKKLHSIPLNTNIDFSKYIASLQDNLYFKNWRTQKFHKVTKVTYEYDVETNATIVWRESIEVDNKGNKLDTAVYTDEFVIKDIYAIDQFLGGAYTLSLNNISGQLEYTNTNIEVTAKIIGDYDLKDKFIAYLVNKSAIKVGAGNINTSSVWYTNDDSKLLTIPMSTKYGGVQMNADHELDFAEVTEMTQMISALEQNGFTHKLTNDIYKDIVKIIYDSMQKFKHAITEGSRKKLYTLLGKALVDSFNGGDKDVLGLAQSFVLLATKSLSEQSLEYKLPFSASTINGAFIATITSMLVKMAIRRKHDGIAGTMTPSHGMIQYYLYNNRRYTFDEMAKIVLENGIANEVNDTGDIVRSAWEIASTEKIINGKLNPFLVKLNSKYEIEQEDYIVVYDKINKTFVEELSGKVDSYERYDFLRHKLNTENLVLLNWSIKPKNLKGSDTKFDLLLPGEFGSKRTTFSIYDLDSVRANFYIQKNTKLRTPEELAIIERAYGQSIKGVSATKIKKHLRRVTQSILKKLSNGQPIPISEAFGITTDNGLITPIVNSVKVIPAQMIMGKMNAPKFGLTQGDKLNDILDYKGTFKNFFHERLSYKYATPNVESHIYDAVLYTVSGKKVLVKFQKKLDSTAHLSKNNNFKTIDGDVYYDGKLLTSTESKQFYSYTNENEEQYDVIVLQDIQDFSELKKSKIFDTYRYNYTENNWKKLFNFVYSKQIEDDKDIRISYKNSQGIVENKVLNIEGENVAKSLQLNEMIKFNDRIIISSEHILESFKKQLLYVGARIPTQSMQSFMPIEVVAFTDSEVADIYVTKYNSWLEGSDYDIDKLYLMGYSIDDNGHFQTLSNLQKDFTIEEVQKLPSPTGEKYIEGEDGIFISLEDLQQVTGTFDNIENVNSTFLSLQPFINILSGPNNGKLIFEAPGVIMFGDKINKPKTDQVLKEFNRRKKEFLRLLNKHNTSKLSGFALERALKNEVVTGIFDVILDPKNQINLHIPIDIVEQQEAAKKSTLGNAEKIMSSDNPATKYIMQVQNMIGKQVIGGVAVSLKVFFGVSNYYNTAIEKLAKDVYDGNQFEIVDKLSKLIFENPKTKKLGIIANVNLEELAQAIVDTDTTLIEIPNTIELSSIFKPYIENNYLNLYELVNELIVISNNTDAALSISGLLSAATDNPKELVLAKINAGSKFVDIYTYLMSIGESFDSIAQIMTSPIFNEVSKLVDSDIFNNATYGFNLENALNFYQNKNILPILKEDVFNHIVGDILQTEPKDSLNLLDYTTSNLQTLKEEVTKKKLGLKQVYIDEYIGSEYMSEYSPEENETEYNEEYYYDAEDYGESLADTKSRDFNINPVTITEYNHFLQLLDYIEVRNKNLAIWEDQGTLKTQFKYLELLSDKVIPATKEMKILGKMLGINQGIKTNNYEKYRYLRTIETFVNQRIEEKNKERRKEKLETSFVNLDIIRFLQDIEYRNEQIGQYENLKSTYNILDIITSIPHFAAMFEILAVDDFLLREFSVRSTTERKLAKEIVAFPTLALNQLEFRELTKYVNDMLITNWLFSEDLKIMIPPNQTYYTGFLNSKEEVSGEPMEVQLNNLHGLATFKNLMDNYIIPEMKKDDIFASNKFIQSLSPTILGDPKSKKVKLYYRLPLNMMQIDASQKTQIIYENILNDFNKISKYEFNGWKIADLFYLYNLIVNKDSFGSNSLTRIFEDLAASNSNLMVNRYNEWLSNKDFDAEKVLQYDTRDLQYRLAGLPGSKYKFNAELKDGKVEVATYVGTREMIDTVDTGIYDPSDFTFGMQFSVNQIAETVKTVVSPIQVEVEKSPTTYELVNAITNKLFDAYEGSVKTFTNATVENSNDRMMQSAKAFINNGTVYINVDKANIKTPLHEYTHIVMAALRATEPNIYYGLLSKITSHEKFEYYAQLPIYAGLYGSDLKEEIFIKVMEEYFDNKTQDIDFSKELSSVEDTIKNMIDYIFDMNTDKSMDLQSIMATNVDTLINEFGSKLFNNSFDSILDINSIKLKQQLMTLKTKAIKDGIIKENCE